MTDEIKILDLLDQAAVSSAGIEITFETKPDMHACRLRIQKRRKSEYDRIIAQHIKLMEAGVIDATVPWPSTGWEDLDVRVYESEKKLWIGRLTEKRLGIVKIEEV